jgi:hypothetical protein
MGEAKRKKQRSELIQTKLDNLAPDAQTVAMVAKRLLQMEPSEGACYRCTLFLRLFLKEEYGIEGEAVIGYVNDGSDDIYPSHAWYEFMGSRTDLALWRPLSPDLQRPGPIVIQGIEIQSGHRWTYHRDRPPAALMMALSLLHDNSMVGQIVRQTEEQHLTMAARVTSDEQIRIYLDSAPDGWTYGRIAQFVRSGLTNNSHEEQE